MNRHAFALAVPHFQHIDGSLQPGRKPRDAFRCSAGTARTPVVVEAGDVLALSVGPMATTGARLHSLEVEVTGQTRLTWRHEPGGALPVGTWRPKRGFWQDRQLGAVTFGDDGELIVGPALADQLIHLYATAHLTTDVRQLP